MDTKSLLLNAKIDITQTASGEWLVHSGAGNQTFRTQREAYDSAVTLAKGQFIWSRVSPHSPIKH